MWRRGLKSRGWESALATALWLVFASAQAAQHLLLEVLEAYEAVGYHFVYSSDLARRHTSIDIDLAADRSIPRLREALLAIGLDLDGHDNGAGTTIWYLVRATGPEPSPTFEGRVTDASSGLPLAGVRVEIGGRVLYTDEDGRFRLASEPVPYIQVSRDGYQPVEVAATVKLDELLEISMRAADRLEEVVVVSSRYALERATGGSVHSLTAHDIETVPEFGDDVLRAANHLPGVASIGLSARPYIRGGLQDETLVLFNNVELLEPFHLKDFQSVFSGFNPSLVESVDVYTGGFPARYGDRMSGVMDIKPSVGTARFGADVMLSFLTASAAVVGTTDNGRGAWALSARRGNLDLVLDVLDPTAGSPRYSDYFGSASYGIGEGTELEAGFIYYDDDVELKDLDDGDGELARSVYRNGYGWLQLHRQWSDRIHSTTVLSYGRIENDREGFIADEDLEEGNSELTDRRGFELWHLGHRQHFDLADRFGVELGGRLNHQRGRYDTLAVIERGVLAELIGSPVTEVRRVSKRPGGFSGGVYGSLRYRPEPWLALEAGLRWDFQDYAEASENHVSPRLSALLTLSPKTSLRFSAGRFYQPEQIHELQAADGIDTYQRAQHADHYIVGLTQGFPAWGLSFRVEAFHKRFQNPKRRFENLFNSLVLMPELASDRIEVAPSQARARGVELSLAYQPAASFSSWFAYTHAYADDEIDERWVKRGWDQRHTISAGIAWEPGAWSFSAAALWHSGWQTTLLPDRLEEDELPLLERNADRLPIYLSLDLRVSRTWRWQSQALVVFLELTNALDRDNVGAYEYDVEEEEAGSGYLLPREPVTLLPRLPSLGLRWTFN